MRARIVILSAISLVFLVAGVAALWLGISGMMGFQGPTSGTVEDQEEWERRWRWFDMLRLFGGPSIGAGLIAGVGALVLVVRARQVAGSTAATASREASRS